MNMFGFRVSYVDGNDFPISFTFIDQSNDTKDFDLQYFSAFCSAWSNFDDIDWIVVTFAARRCINVAWILPGLRKCAIIPNVPMIWKSVGDIAQSTMFDILLDGIECFTSGNFHFGIGPPRYFNHHVVNIIWIVSTQWNVVKGRNRISILISKINAVVFWVGFALFNRHVFGCRCIQLWRDKMLLSKCFFNNCNKEITCDIWWANCFVCNQEDNN